MDEQRAAELVGRAPERIERGIVEHAADALRLRPDHRACKARRMRLAQHLRGARAVLQRHGGERDQARLCPRGGEQMLVREARPARAFLRRQFVAEHVEPAADHLALDLLLVHPFQPGGKIAQRFRHRARRLAAAEREPERRAVLDQAQRRKRCGLRADRLEQARRNEMGVAVDHHAACSRGLPRARRDGVADRGEADGQPVERDAERRDRVVDRARNRGGRAEIAGLARAFLAEHRERRGRAMMHDLDARHLVRGRQQIVHEGLAHHLPVVAVDELLHQRGADAVRDAAERHALDDVRIDHRAAVMADRRSGAIRSCRARDRSPPARHGIRTSGTDTSARGRPRSAASVPVGTCITWVTSRPGSKPGGIRWMLRCAMVTSSIHSSRLPLARSLTAPPA